MTSRYYPAFWYIRGRLPRRIGSILFLGIQDGRKTLACLSNGSGLVDRLPGVSRAVAADGHDLSLRVCELSEAAANELRGILPYLVPKTLGLAKSAGCGDRLGLATPGHVRAIRRSSMAPIFAQQSIRENARTGRTPQEVMDEAMWGVFQEGWREGFGADADHLKEHGRH